MTVRAFGGIARGAATTGMLLAAGCSSGGSAPQAPQAKSEIVVSAASSLRDVLTQVAERYEESHPGSHVVLNFGASNMLSRQIVQGAPVDMAVFADGRAMDAVEGTGRLQPGSRFDLLSNTLVVIVPSDRHLPIARAEDLRAPPLQRMAVCNEAVPIGHYARRWLGAKGVLARLERVLVEPDDARAALAMVASGSVDAGIVYRTDAVGAKGVTVALEIPSNETPGIVYPTAALRDGANPAGGKDFLQFASTPPAVWLFRGAGFTILTTIR